MDLDQKVIEQLHNKIVLNQPLLRIDDGLTMAVADLRQFHPRDFFPLEQIRNGAKKECYILTPRRLLYGTVCPDRRGNNGYWKISNCMPVDIICSNGLQGTKRNLTFYEGNHNQNNGRQTLWKKIEYRLRNQPQNSIFRDHKGRREEWVICKIYEDFREDDLCSEMELMEID